MNKYYYGSSETIRKAPYFCFEDFYKYAHAHHVPRIDESFLQWFIGFCEGDGSFSYTKTSVYHRQRNGKSYIEHVSERLRFSICQKERRIVEKIAYKFGFGRVSSFNKGEETYWRWSLESKKSIESMAYLLSGNLVLPYRQKQFLKWIEIGQKKSMFQPPFDKMKPWYSNVDLNNAWLSGFIDAEGCFYANFSLPIDLKKQISQLPIMKKKWSKQHHEMFLKLSQYKLRLTQKMTLTQISTEETNELFKKILLLFEGTSFCVFQNKTMKKTTAKSYVRIEFSSLSSLNMIVNYLDTYALQTIKNVAFKRWTRVYFRRKDKVHLSPKGTQRLYRLVKAINHHSKQLYDKKYIQI